MASENIVGKGLFHIQKILKDITVPLTTTRTRTHLNYLMMSWTVKSSSSHTKYNNLPKHTIIIHSEIKYDYFTFIAYVWMHTSSLPLLQKCEEDDLILILHTYTRVLHIFSLRCPLQKFSWDDEIFILLLWTVSLYL